MIPAPAHIRTVHESVTRNRKSPLVREIVTTPRRCLDCRRMFDSTGPGNRLCEKCVNRVPVENRKSSGARKRIYNGGDVEAD